MKNRALTCAFVLLAGLASAGGAMAESRGVSPASSPSTTPNDGTAVPPNQPVPPGQIPPAPNAAPNTQSAPPSLNSDNPMKAGNPSSDMPKRAREANDNVPRTPAGGATPPPGYPNTGGK
ncbi:hypothetical protein [Achromobacter deleyi]|uniref:hypothetical protein n=1 Tax=Achromobacter deleyi TaxID=1353891 RepID=UPI0014922FFE|nr:hypothetical protein [Achromobacter deleyi]QVQ28107.1 hypothetical protein HLG70_06640 [Achromobacter deleyi]UIP18294.1 hypothetical protein LYZ39_14765 [Achromobacter deleyi]